MHEKLEEYYNEINEEIDIVAEHILMLGYQPLGTMTDYLENATIEEAKNEKVKSCAVITNLIEDYTILLQKANKIKRLADEKSHYSTSTMIDDCIGAYTKNLWMLKQSQE